MLVEGHVVAVSVLTTRVLGVLDVQDVGEVGDVYGVLMGIGLWIGSGVGAGE